MDSLADQARAAAPAAEITVLVPVLDDWEPLAILVRGLAAALAGAGQRARLVVVDDGSTRRVAAASLAVDGLADVAILRLRRNLGHQRAIAVGLCWIHEHRPGTTVVVMDGDGEDDPADVPRLAAAAAEGSQVVFAERVRRSESLLFRAFYQVYKLVHRLLTGMPVKVGNFSAVPYPALEALVVVSELWSHYAAAVVRARIPHRRIPTVRARRLGGRSQMRFVPLVAHGLAAMSVFAEIVGVRLLLATVLLLGVLAGSLAVGGAWWIVAGVVPAPWALVLWGFLGLFFLQAVALATVFVFVVLAGRQGTSFLPLRDYVHYVHGVDATS